MTVPRIALVSLIACLALSDAARAQTLTMQGLGPAKTKTLTVADFDALPHVTLTVQQHGRARVFEGVSLLELMRQVGGPWGDTLTGKQLAEVLLVTCKDGYRVAYSIAEADPGTSKGQVLVVDKAGRCVPGPQGRTVPDRGGERPAPGPLGAHG